jgi:hypothetical protein
MTRLPKPALPLLGAALLALGLTACGSQVSTGSFKGEQHQVAQAIANLQTDARAGDEQKVCANDLAASVVTRLNAAPGGCKRAIKDQLAQIDNFDVTVESVQITGTAGKRTATAKVKSVYSGKSRIKTVTLVPEAGKWKLLAIA